MNKRIKMTKPVGLLLSIAVAVILFVPEITAHHEAKAGENKADMEKKLNAIRDRLMLIGANEKIRELFDRELRGEDVCIKEYKSFEENFVCTTENVFKWHDTEFMPYCRKCAGWKNPFTYEWCMEGKLRSRPDPFLPWTC